MITDYKFDIADYKAWLELSMSDDVAIGIMILAGGIACYFALRKVFKKKQS